MSKFHKTFERIVPDCYYLQVTGRPSCGQEVIDVVADSDINVGFEQFMIAVDCYAAINPLRPWMTLQSCAVICVISLSKMNLI